MSPAAEVVIAGSGVAASATAIRLLRLGIGARLIVRHGDGPAGIEALPQRALRLLEVLGEPRLLARAGGVEVAGPTHGMVHVERRSLAAAFLEHAMAEGAMVEQVRRLPPLAEVASSAVAVVDATGRAAAWSRPLILDGHSVAWQLEGPAEPDLALRVVQAEGWWAYRLGMPATTWAGVVVDAGVADARTTEAGLRRLGLDPASMTPRGRRAARVQRALHPVSGRRIAVGDAALAQDPIAGGGIRFALASAVAAATVVATWVGGGGDLAATYYNQLVAGEHSRHLEARRANHALSPGTEGSEAEPVPDILQFCAPVLAAPLVIDGTVQRGEAIKLPDGSMTRWLGSFDLFVLARLSAEPIPRIVLLAQLQNEGLDRHDAQAVLSWSMRHGLLSKYF